MKAGTAWMVWAVGATIAAVSSLHAADQANGNATPDVTGRSPVIGSVERANRLIGREVRNGQDERIGRIDDLVVDLESGRALYAVVSVGGFLGVGDRLVAVPASAFTEQGERVKLDADRDKLTSAPAFSTEERSRQQMFSTSFTGNVYRHFGEQAWFESGEREFGNVHKASSLMGMDVRNVPGEPIGEVENLVVDLSAGRIPYVVLAPDRSLRLEDRLYAVPPNALTLSSDRKSLNADIDRQKLATAPSFPRGEWPNLASRDLGTRVYRHFGKRPYFESESLKPTSNTNRLERLYHEPERITGGLNEQRTNARPAND